MAAIPAIERVVVVPYLEKRPVIGEHSPALSATTTSLPRTGAVSLDFVQLPADHPLYIMYSSGTTGPPKCMVQGAAGILVNHLKELMLHTDLKRDDTILYLTTCGWMMWNWLVSSLAVGATIVLYEGHPFHPGPGALWQLAQDEGITVFGTSARYLASLEKSGVQTGAGVRPLAAADHPLHRLPPLPAKASITSTGRSKRTSNSPPSPAGPISTAVSPWATPSARSIPANSSAGASA